MRYLILIHRDPAEFAKLSKDVRQEHFARHEALTEDMRRDGVYIVGMPVAPGTAAKVLRHRDGEQLLTDGPYAESKEVLGGFYVIDCESFDQAVAYAARIPSVTFGAIEIRPEMSLGVPA